MNFLNHIRAEETDRIAREMKTRWRLQAETQTGLLTLERSNFDRDEWTHTVKSIVAASDLDLERVHISEPNDEGLRSLECVCRFYRSGISATATGAVGWSRDEKQTLLRIPLSCKTKKDSESVSKSFRLFLAEHGAKPSRIDSSKIEDLLPPLREALIPCVGVSVPSENGTHTYQQSTVRIDTGGMRLIVEMQRGKLPYSKTTSELLSFDSTLIESPKQLAQSPVWQASLFAVERLHTAVQEYPRGGKSQFHYTNLLFPSQETAEHLLALCKTTIPMMREWLYK